MDWPLRDALNAYLYRVKEQARDEYRTIQLMYAAGARFDGSESCPPPPPILTEG